MSLYYDPEIFGWSKMSPALRNELRETVHDNVRKACVIYLRELPVYTTNRLLSDEEFIKQALRLRRVFRNEDSPTFRMVYTYDSKSGPSLYFPVKGKPEFTDALFMVVTVWPEEIGHHEALLALVKHAFKLMPKKEIKLDMKSCGNDHVLTVQHNRMNEFSATADFKIPERFRVIRKDVSNMLKVFTHPNIGEVGWEDRLQNMPEVIATLNKMDNDAEIMLSDKEIAALPKRPALSKKELKRVEQMTLNDAPSSSTQTEKEKKKKKKKKSPPKKNGQPVLEELLEPAEPEPQVYVPRVVRKRAQEMLDHIGMPINYKHPKPYMGICPAKRGPQDTVRKSYQNALQCNNTQDKSEMRRRRDTAITCALLRTRKQHQYFYDSEKTRRHMHPISVAYATATSCSKRIGMQEQKNRDIADWLMLKGGSVHPDEYNIRNH